MGDQFCLYVHTGTCRPQFNHNMHMYIRSVNQNLYKNSNQQAQQIQYSLWLLKF